MSSLEIGKRALLAQRLGLDVTSNNIANVNTPGYSRQQAIFSETDPRFGKGGFLGTGVIADKLRTFREEYYDREIRTTLSRKSLYAEDELTFQRIEAILAEPSEYGLNEEISKFFNAFEELSGNPQNVGLRDYVLGVSSSLVERFHTTAQKLIDTRKEIGGKISTNIDAINKMLSDISELNGKVANSKAMSSIESQTLVDQRELILENLSELTGINVTQGQNGMVNVFINGINVVTGTSNSTLKSNEVINQTTGERTIQITKVDSQGNTMNVLNIQSGELASQIKHYNTTLDDKDTSGGFSAMKKLDEFANALATKINAMTINGYGLDDTTAPPPGRTFFVNSSGTFTASDIEIASDIRNNPRNIPLSDAPGEPGNSTIALQIARLANDSTFLDSSTPSEFYSGYLGKIGTLGNEAVNGNTTTTLIFQQLGNQRESVIGVNLDEEGINLIKYQKAFEASSRIINTTNDLLNTVINLGL